jgi:hypothetical protein
MTSEHQDGKPCTRLVLLETRSGFHRDQDNPEIRVLDALRLHVARGIRHEGSRYCQTVITAGSEAIDSLKLLFSSVTKVMADSQLRFYGVVREKRG